MGVAFDTAWQVLKEERIPNLIHYGEGGYRKVYAEDGDDFGEELTKIPKYGMNEGDLTHNATMNALAQLGYPIEPENLKIIPEHHITDTLSKPRKFVPFKTPVFTQRMADSINTVPLRLEMSRGRRSMAADKQRINRQILLDRLLGRKQDPHTVGFGDLLSDKKREQIYAEHRGSVPDFPLSETSLPYELGISDIGGRNTGIYGGEPKVIDAQTDRPSGIAYADNNEMELVNALLRVPKEQRRSFVDLFTDKSQFKDIADYDYSNEPRVPEGMSITDAVKMGFSTNKPDQYPPILMTPMEMAHDAYADYLQDVRALQLANSLIEDPYQTRLDEYDGSKEMARARRAAAEGQGMNFRPVNIL